MADDFDLEAELMDLTSNEHAYLPTQPHALRHSFSGSMRRSSSSSSSSGASSYSSHTSASTSHPASLASSSATPPPPPATPTHQAHAHAPPPTLVHLQQQQQQQQMLRAAVDQRQAVQQQARDRFEPRTSSSASLGASTSSSLSSSGSSVSAFASSLASSLGLRSPSESHEAAQDDQWMRKKAAFSAIVRLRQQQIVARVGSPNIDPRSRIQPTGDPAVDAMEQMAAKLDAVVEASLEELQVAPTATLWTQILQELPPEESDYLAKAADEKFAEQMKYCSARKVEREIHACVAHHLEAILVSSVPTRNGQSMAKSMHHSLGDLLRDFRGVFLSCYEEFTQQYDVPQVAAVLPLVTADVLQFAGILVQLLLFKYAFLAKWKTHVRRCVLAALFDLLQPTLHGLYVGAFRTEDAVMEDIASLKRSTSPAEFGIAPVFRLDGSWQSPDAISPEASQQEAMRQYGAAIHRMNNLASIRSPWVKVEALALICREIDGTIKTYYAKQPVQPSHEEININADALRAILAFVLVSSPSMCLHVFSQLAILSSYLPETFAAGEEGFALATFTAAVRLVSRLP